MMMVSPYFNMKKISGSSIIFRLHILCGYDVEGLFWVAHSDSFGRPILDDGYLGHSQESRFSGRNNVERYAPGFTHGDFDGNSCRIFIAHFVFIERFSSINVAHELVWLSSWNKQCNDFSHHKIV